MHSSPPVAPTTRRRRPPVYKPIPLRAIASIGVEYAGRWKKALSGKRQHCGRKGRKLPAISLAQRRDFAFGQPTILWAGDPLARNAATLTRLRDPFADLECEELAEAPPSASGRLASFCRRRRRITIA
jgi:hypothetical protein